MEGKMKTDKPKTVKEYDYDSDFPSRLRKLMDDTQTKQQKLADITGVKRQCVAQWKDGKTKPDIINLQIIANYFDVSTDYLLGLSDVRSRDELTRATAEKYGLDEEALSALASFVGMSKQETIIGLLAHCQLSAINSLINNVIEPNKIKKKLFKHYVSKEVLILDEASDTTK
jgi:transcriptional regulator with XRE-family HTH domain